MASWCFYSRYGNFVGSCNTLEKLRTFVSNPGPETVDIDGDGVVGVNDLRVAKMFDADGSGILDEEERLRGRCQMARSFCLKYKDRVTPRGSLVQGSNFPGKQHSLNPNTYENTVKELVNAPNFEKTMATLDHRRVIQQANRGKVARCLVNDAHMREVKSDPEEHNRFSSVYDRTWGDGHFAKDRRSASTKSYAAFCLKKKLVSRGPIFMG